MRWAALTCLMVFSGSSASAQYLGRNKVRLRVFDFQVLKTEHFDVYFYPGEREGVDIAARLAERWYVRLERLFRHELSGRQPLILYASHADFEQTNVIPEVLTEGIEGVTEPSRRRIVLPLAGPIKDTDHVIGHELVHAFQFDIAQSMKGSHEHTAALEDLPLWFIEGMAEYVSLGAVDANTAMKLRDATEREQLPSFQDLADPKYFPYQWGHAAWAYLAGRYGDAVIPRLFRLAAVSDDLAAALTTVLQTSSNQLSSDWHTAIRAQYAPVLSAAIPLADTGRPVIKEQTFGAELNVGPALSPDGRWMAFLSARGGVSADLYIADTETGDIVQRLTSTATDPHFSSIQFIYSAGAWDRSSEHIAVATTVAGRATLTIFNARSGTRDREIRLNGVDEILNPAWSPDDRAIAFTGLRQGLTDLYVFDLGAAKLHQITNDPFADLHPAWAPDSRRLVFVSDRWSSNLEWLHMEPLQLSIADTQSREIVALPAFEHATHINPQWSSDGKAVYFIANPDGVPNVFRLSLTSRDIQQMTVLGVGVSGITPTSPALSVSSGTGRIAFGVYRNESYDIRILNPMTDAAPGSLLPVNAAALPPADRAGGSVGDHLTHPEEGMPRAQTYPMAAYKSRLSLVGAGQLTGGVSVGRFGPAAGGGAALFFSDMLGDQLLGTAVNVSSWSDSFSANDIAFESAYFNLRRRWNWGVTGGQVPSLVRSTFDTALSKADGENALAIDRVIFHRETQRGGSGVVSYPFDRARRIEFRGGFTQVGFEQIVNTVSYQPSTLAVHSNTTRTIQYAPHLDLATTAVAYVFDTADFGPTSPVEGQRYRVEVAPAFGSISFVGVLADYRRYVMPVSFFTLATRVVHYGRYGRDGDGARLQPGYINAPGLIRGYDTQDDPAVCGAPPADSCLAHRFAGSRILIGNLELRFPLLRPFETSHGMYGPLPTEIALFADSGVAWNRGEKPSIFGGSRSGIGSAGLAFRVGLGFLVSEFDVTRALQRPGPGWTFGFNLAPGW